MTKGLKFCIIFYVEINDSVFEKVKRANARILVVTKYYEKIKTEALISTCEQKYSSMIFGYGENRVEGIGGKGLERNKTHFIGNLQTKKLRKILKYCSVIHSLDSLKHARYLDLYLNELKIKNEKLTMKVFLQIKLDPTKPTGINPEDLSGFLKDMKVFKNLEMAGISGMSSLREGDHGEGKKEFQLLLDLRNKYLPGKLISAGTSQDYEIALKMGIDVVRVGRAAVV